jgi:hypothetical protein
VIRLFRGLAAAHQHRLRGVLRLALAIIAATAFAACGSGSTDSSAPSGLSNGNTTSPVGSDSASPSGCVSSCAAQPVGGGQSGGVTLQTVKGTVTACSATNISVQPSSGGSARTFTITTNTQLALSAQGDLNAYNAGDIHVGDAVSVGVINTDPSQAQLVTLNPS